MSEPIQAIAELVKIDGEIIDSLQILRDLLALQQNTIDAILLRVKDLEDKPKNRFD